MTLRPTTIAVFVEGGIVQSVLRPDAKRKDGHEPLNYEVVDYDMFECDDDEDIVTRWNAYSEPLKNYFRKHLKGEHRKFMDTLARTGKCADCDFKPEENNPFVVNDFDERICPLCQSLDIHD